MHSRRLACFFIGLWLGGCVLVAWSAAHSFRNVDRVLAQPGREASLQIQKLGSEGARRLLRYQASELNRAAFENWETAQLFIGMGFFFYLLFGTRESKFVLGAALLMLLIVLLQRFAVTPELTAIGRHLDYAAGGAAVGDRAKFSMLHRGYAALELVKLAVGLALALKLALSGGGRSRDSRKQFDAVNERNYGHIDR